ncbi:hypothetical protein E2P81_ATG02875 [Venturia nashicola]|nr:hypothetical protein E2P81_ATG02875 [Venturia nashicola]
MSNFTAINDNIKTEDLVDAIEAPEAPKTPKRKSAAQGGTPKKAKNDTPKSSARNIKSSKIPESFDELAEEDKMLIEWKERGEGWNTIYEEWNRITGNMPGKSTLPVRIGRIKAALACVAPEDIAKMVEYEAVVTQEIEAEYKDALAKKWTRVSKRMEDNGIQTYPAATLEKQFKKMKACGTLGSATQSAPAEADGADAEMES